MSKDNEGMSKDKPPPLEITPTVTGVSIEYDNTPLVSEIGVAIPIDGRWRWSFDRSLRLLTSDGGTGRDSLGPYASLALTYGDDDGPWVRQEVKAYQDGAFVVVEATALRELRGAALGDSFFETTFNAPVVLPADGLRFLAYTWGLSGGEGPGIAGHFPDAALAQDLADLPEKLRLADFSPRQDVHHTTEKPFAPLVMYDDSEHTVVISPLNHYLISPLRLLETPTGTGVARGLHGSIDVIPSGTITRTMITFGLGLAPTVIKWGETLCRVAGKDRAQSRDSLIAHTLGFWNCYGGYYAQLFRPTTGETLGQLANYFNDAGLPVRYWGLDLWYDYETVGFARRYISDPNKYPEGLDAIFQDTGIPYLLHMSSFDRDTHYMEEYDMEVGEGSAFPKTPQLYQDLAKEFQSWGATGIWPDFLRTLMQNCRPLRQRLGAADDWFRGMAASMAEQGLDVMLCMPTMGHYLASTAHENVVAIRTSTDYVNHQQGQLELLAHLQEYRSEFPLYRNLRQNLMLSFLAAAVGLAPSHDVFISNADHPEGFANPNAGLEALMRALSAGVVGVGDKLGYVDQDVVGRLAFPDGTLAQPDHPLYPVASHLLSDTPLFYTETVVSGYSWKYLAIFNLSDTPQEYRVDLGEILAGDVGVTFDYYAGTVVIDGVVHGTLDPGAVRYLIRLPAIAGLYPLGFWGKYVPLSGRQVKAITANHESVSLHLELPTGRDYTLAFLGEESILATGRGLRVTGVEKRGELSFVDFRVEASHCSLIVRN